MGTGKKNFKDFGSFWLNNRIIQYVKDRSGNIKTIYKNLKQYDISFKYLV